MLIYIKFISRINNGIRLTQALLLGEAGSQTGVDLVNPLLHAGHDSLLGEALARVLGQDASHGSAHDVAGSGLADDRLLELAVALFKEEGHWDDLCLHSSLLPE